MKIRVAMTPLLIAAVALSAAACGADSSQAGGASASAGAGAGAGGEGLAQVDLAALSIACALLLWRVITANRASAKIGPLLAASAFWGIAIGFRSDLAIFIAPVWLVAAWGAPLAAWLAGAATIGVLIDEALLYRRETGGDAAAVEASVAQAEPASD